MNSPMPPGGAAIRVAEGITTPNGLQLSHDEKTLYVNDTGGINIYAFDVQPDGRLVNRRVFAGALAELLLRHALQAVGAVHRHQ